MKRILFLFILAAIAAGSARAQSANVNVTATIVDPNGIPYSFAQVTIRLQPPGIASPVCGGPSGGGVSDQQVTTNAAGTFNISICPNSSIVPSSPPTTWGFTVSEAGVPPPLGTGAQSFTVPVSITGAADISTQLNAAALSLANVGGGSVGPGTVNSVACFNTTTNVHNCPGGATDISGVFNIPEQVTMGSGTGAGSVGIPSGNTSTCVPPTAGSNNLCSDGTNNTIDESLNGAPYIPLGSLANGSVGFPAAYTDTNAAVSVPLAVVTDAVNGAGVGATPLAWVTATNYPLCQSVSFSAANYIAVSPNNNSVTPGTNRSVWYPVPNGSRPTQHDCAFYVAYSMITGSSGFKLSDGIGSYNSCIGMNYTTVSSPGQALLDIEGAGSDLTFINQTCNLNSGAGGDGLAMLNVPAAAVAFALPTIHWKGFTLAANNNAPAVFDLHACQQCFVEDVAMRDAVLGADHYFEAGTIGGGSTGWVFELTMRDVKTGYTTGNHGNGAAAATATVSGGVPTITVTNGGSGYSASQLSIRLVKQGGLEACSSPGTNTPTIVVGVITAVTSTATGCAATGQTFVQFFPQVNVNYSFKFSNMTDSSDLVNIVPGGVGAIAGIYLSNVCNMNSFRKIHPQGVFNGVQDSGNTNWYDSQIDSVYNWGFDFEGANTQTNLVGSMFEWNANHYDGSSDYHFGTITNPPTSSPSAINIYGDICGDRAQQNAYAHFVSATGAVDAGNTMPSFVNVIGATQYCNIVNTNNVEAAFTGQNFIWSGGKPGAYLNWNLGSGGNTAFALWHSLGNPWTMFFQNNNAATSGTNPASPQFGVEANYWDGSVSQPYGPRFRATCAAGTGPLCTFFLDHQGTEPAGGHVWSIDSTASFAGHVNQSASGQFARTCTMAASTTCTASIGAAYTGTPICIASQQSSGAVIAGECSISGTTITITAASSNSSTWGAVLIGNPN